MILLPISSDYMSIEPHQRSALPESRRQYSVRTLLLTTSIVAILYACLNWFGVIAHVVVWASILVVGIVLGIILGIKRLKERNPIVNGVQGGAFGGATGFACGLVLLAPTFAQQPLETLCYVAFFGTVLTFMAGGFVGLLTGLGRHIFNS